MHAFTDRAGRTWQVTIDVTAIKRVQGLLGLDLYALIDDGMKPLGALVSNPVRLVDVLFVLCQDEVKERGLTDEDFGRGFAGDALEAARDAFVDEYMDFFHARARAPLVQALRKMRAVQEKLLTHASREIDAVNIDSAAEKLLRSFGASPESSASTPDPSP